MRPPKACEPDDKQYGPEEKRLGRRVAQRRGFRGEEVEGYCGKKAGFTSMPRPLEHLHSRDADDRGGRHGLPSNELVDKLVDQLGDKLVDC